MRFAAKTLGVALLSVVGALVWWAYFPEPPLPDRFLVLFEPGVVFVMAGDVHGGEELLTLLRIWSYVFGILLVAWTTNWILRRQSSIRGAYR
jgi:hypothetical protein